MMLRIIKTMRHYTGVSFNVARKVTPMRHYATLWAMDRTEWLLHDYVFKPLRVDLETLRPWIEFVLRVASDGAASETQTRLRTAVMAIATRGSTARHGASRVTGPEASRQFQIYVRDQINPPGSTELAHLDTAAREEFLKKQVLERYVSHLPNVGFGLDEKGHPCLKSEPTPDVYSKRNDPVATEPGDLRRFEGEWLSQLATAHEAKCLAVVATIGADSDAAKLKRCAHCQRFFWSTTAHRRKHNFCRPGHRRAYNVAHRDLKKSAAHMRSWRAARKALAAGKRKKESRARMQSRR
jgi:hypothetical protein